MTLRPATLDDLTAMMAVEDQFHPDEPIDPVTKRHQWTAVDPDRVVERWVVESENRLTAYLVTFHKRWETVTERRAWAYLGYLPEFDPRPLVDFATDRVAVGGGRHLVLLAREDDARTITALVAAGFRRDSLEKSWELDLVAHRDRLLELTTRTRAAMGDQGVRVLPASEDPNPEILRRVYEAWIDARRDVPRSHEVPAPTFAGWMAWMTAPDVRSERLWIATVEGRLIGLSYLRYPPVRGNVWTGFTGTVRDVRGRGIARAVKMETLAQAIELGVPRVRTGNDERNAPMLHINQDLGYVAIPGFVAYEKDI
ncbi:MAG: hypothetical protein NVS9B1_14410 [Candidatus Dormibacteraceae bacterium]